MPDYNEVHQSKEGARRDAKFIASQYRDSGEKVRKESQDLYSVKGGAFYIEVTECHERDCLSSGDSVFDL